jgi:hypothetical protein
MVCMDPANPDPGPLQVACGHLRALIRHDFAVGRTENDDKEVPDHDPDFVYDLARTLMDRQMATIDANDSKITNVAASSLTLVGLFASVLAFKPDHVQRALTPLIIAAVCAVLVSVLAFLAQRPVKWQAEETIAAAMAAEGAGTRTRAAKWQTVWLLEWGLEHNKVGSKAKAWAVRVGLAVVLVETLALVAGALLIGL